MFHNIRSLRTVTFRPNPALRKSTLAFCLSVILLHPLACPVIAARVPEPRNPVGRADAASAIDSVRFLLHISVDGLRPDAVVVLGPLNAPNFHRLIVEGMSTNNARTDYDITTTLPNHTCQITARAAGGPDGHGVTFNSDDGRTLEEVHGTYVAGVFDVAHDHGLTTALYAGKSKFDFLARSWNATNGAPDTVGGDDGRGKIDVYINDPNTDSLVEAFIGNTIDTPCRYSFIHLRDLDAAGHYSGWSSMAYYDAAVEIDHFLGRIFDLVDTSGAIKGRTAIILTSDHGGSGISHDNPANPDNYTVPLCIWGPGIPAGADLYIRNQSSRLDPGNGRPDYQSLPQPIRHADAANLALDLLDLSPVPGSTINQPQDLDVAPPGGGALPGVSITSPPDGSAFEVLDTVIVEAAAWTETDSITVVEFFANWSKLGEDESSPYSFKWEVVPAGGYTLTAMAVRSDGCASTSSVDIVVTSAAAADGRETNPAGLPRVYPNPFRLSARIEFSLFTFEHVALEIFDVRGRKIYDLPGSRLGPGVHALYFDSAGVAPGCYFYLLRIGNVVRSGKLVVAR